MQQFSHLFSPFRIKNTVFRNRIEAAPNGTKHKTPEGYPLELELREFEQKAKGGAAIITTGNSTVSSKYGMQPRSRNLAFGDPNGLIPMTELANAMRKHGAVASVELNHPGPLSQPQFSGGRSPIGPDSYIRSDGIQVEAMTEEQIEDAINEFASAAKYAADCGFGMCMVHAGHGWLISSFLSKTTNHRTDRWGGSAENRARMAVEICDRIHKVCGEDFIVEVRISAEEFVEGGMHVNDAIEVTRELEGHADLIHLSACGFTAPHHSEDRKAVKGEETRIWSLNATPHVMKPQGCFVEFAEAFKKAGIKTPIVTVGAIQSPEMAEEIIASGKADFVAMARALIADPFWPNKAKAGRVEDIRPCFRCETCNQRIASRRCAVNPELGATTRLFYTDPNPAPKKVAIIGGGPAGMEAAITAASRGHDVTLYEKSSALGGLLKSITHEYLKRELRPYLDYLVRKTEASCRVLLNTEATKEVLEEAGYDNIILAVGAKPVIPPIPGIENSNMIEASCLHEPEFDPGSSVAVIGGGLAGVEIAWEFAREGKRVWLIEVEKKFYPECDTAGVNYSMPIFADLKTKDNASILPETMCTGWKDGSLTLLNKATGEESVIKPDSVVIATGMKPDTETVDKLWGCAPDAIAIGDCAKPRRILEAVSEGYYAALDL